MRHVKELEQATIQRQSRSRTPPVRPFIQAIAIFSVSVLAASMVLPAAACSQESDDYRLVRSPAFGKPVLGVHLAGATRLAVYFGTMVGGRHDQYLSNDTVLGESTAGPVVVAELGIGGGSISGGFGFYAVGAALASMRLQISVLRTWWKTRHASPSQWFLGPELQMTFGIGIRLGYFWRVGGNRHMEDSFLTFGWVLGI